MDKQKVVDPPPEQDTTARDESAKKPYEKPQIVYRAPLEVMAASCLTAPGKTFDQLGISCWNASS